MGAGLAGEFESGDQTRRGGGIVTLIQYERKMRMKQGEMACLAYVLGTISPYYPPFFMPETKWNHATAQMRPISLAGHGNWDGASS